MTAALAGTTLPSVLMPPDDGSTATVSVVIVSWNAKAYLAECLGSLSPSVCRYPMEIIVVDNASADGSPEMVKNDFPHVKLVRNGENLGFAKASNRGIAVAQGEFVALINSDVHVLDDALTLLVDHCKAHRDIGIVGPRIIGGDGHLQRSCRGFPSVWNMFCRALALDIIFPRTSWFGGYLLKHWSHEELRDADILSGCFWLVRRDAMRVVGLLDEGFFIYGEDMDWCLRFRQRGWRAVFLPEAEAIHYGGASSANAPIRFFVEKQRADLRYWAKHHAGLPFWAYFAISCLHHALRVAAYGAQRLLRRDAPSTAAYKWRRSMICLQWMLSRSPTRNEMLMSLAHKR